MANNTLLTINMIVKEAMRVLKNNLVFAAGVNRTYDKYFASSGGKINDTLRIRKPARYVVNTGRALVVQDSIEEFTTVQITDQLQVGMSFNSDDLALRIDQFSERFIVPAMAAISNRIEQLGLQLAEQIYNTVGSTTSLANTFEVYTQAGALLDSCAAPMDAQRSVIIGPYTQAGLLNNLKGLFQASDEISNQYKKGRMGTMAGFDFKMSQNTVTHIVGSAAADPIIVNGANQTGSTLIVSGMTAGKVINKGDTFTMPGVFAINPQNRQSTGKLQQFVVTATSGAAATTLSISPALVGPGAQQTVSALPANGAALTFIGTPNQQLEFGLAFHKDAFTLVSVDLELPQGDSVQASRVSDPETGVSIRVTRQWDINSDSWPCRLDLLIGWAVLRPELAVKIISNTAA